MQFVNETLPIELEEYEASRSGYYRYDIVSKYLTLWSRLFQGVISQCATHLLTGKFHDQDTAIHVSEGGCNIANVGELVLIDRYCSFTSHRTHDNRRVHADICAELITHVVLKFDPMQPVESLLEAGADLVAMKVDGNLEMAKRLKVELKAAIEQSVNKGGPFSGNMLSCFFDRVRGYDSQAFGDSLRPYRRYCRTTFEGVTDADVDREFADTDLGRELLKKLKGKYERQHGPHIMCCAPDRLPSGELRFWINCSRNAGIDPGWYSEEDVRRMIEVG